jgi:hypothetical protein
MATDTEVTSAISAQFVAGKNKIINGDFGIWQRGTTTTFAAATSGGFVSDRWQYLCDDGSGSGSKTISQQTFTPGTAPVSGYEGQYFIRVNCTVASTVETYSFLTQFIEDVRTFAGQTITISFWAKAAASTTMPSVAIRQSFGSGGSGAVDTSVTTNIAVTTSWQRFSYSVAVPSVSGKTIGSGSYLRIGLFSPNRATFTLDFWGVQVEAGSVATAFQTATGTLQGELAACQRYFQRIGNNASPYYMYTCAAVEGVSTLWGAVPLPVTMRTVPSMSATSSGNTFTFLGYGNVAASFIYLDTAQSSQSSICMGSNTISGLTANQSRYIRNLNDSSGTYISLSAEL